MLSIITKALHPCTIAPTRVIGHETFTTNNLHSGFAGELMALTYPKEPQPWSDDSSTQASSRNADVRTTLKYYTHTTPARVQGAMQAIGGMYRLNAPEESEQEQSETA